MLVKREEESTSFLEYCKARRKDFEGLKDLEQPMLEVLQVPNVMSNLTPTRGQETPAQAKFVLKCKLQCCILIIFS